MGGRIVIFGGGQLGDWALQVLREGDTLVGADRGAWYLLEHGLIPDVALGDFDSVSDEERARIKRESRQYLDCDPVHKDETDMELAFGWAAVRQPDELVLLGALGSRLDHSLANIQLLRRAQELGIACSLIDATNRIRLTADVLQVDRGGYTYVSLLPLTSVVTGITLSGFRYPLQDAKLTIGQSLGISNELEGDRGTVRIGDGLLLVIESRD